MNWKQAFDIDPVHRGAVAKVRVFQVIADTGGGKQFVILHLYSEADAQKIIAALTEVPSVVDHPKFLMDTDTEYVHSMEELTQLQREFNVEVVQYFTKPE